MIEVIFAMSIGFILGAIIRKPPDIKKEKEKPNSDQINEIKETAESKTERQLQNLLNYQAISGDYED